MTRQPWAQHRLRSAQEFSAVLKQKHQRTFGVTRWWMKPAPPRTLKLGLIVSRRCGNAVQRNRYKRRLRALFREYLVDAVDGFLLVVQVKPTRKPWTYQDFEAIMPDVREWLRRHQHSEDTETKA